MGIVYITSLVFLKYTLYIIIIKTRLKHTIRLTEPGRELLERNLCGKCGLALGAANVVANKLSILLRNADERDVIMLEEFYNE